MTDDERRIISEYVQRVAGAAQPAAASASPWGGRAPSVAPTPQLPPVDREADAMIAQLFQQYPEARYRITEATTKIDFTGTKPGGDKHDGGFKRVSGVIVLVDGFEPQVDVEIDCGSLHSDNFLLTWHLKGADFFNVKKHPRARFTSTSVRRSEDGYLVTGNLTLLGVTRPVSFPASLTGGETIRLRGTAVLNRQEFGMNYGKGKIDDNVAVRFDVNAAR
jgi:polyisoprenoid-binding protein YceI